MKKYKLINNKTKEETICSLVTIDGFDYYVSDNRPKVDKNFIIKCKNVNDWNFKSGELKAKDYSYFVVKCVSLALLNPEDKTIIATNNPNIDIAQIIDNVENLASDALHDFQKIIPKTYNLNGSNFYEGFKEGYNKAKETYQFTEENMIDFFQWMQCITDVDGCTGTFPYEGGNFTENRKELLAIWKKQKINVLYYE